jgi:hypothetical protein
MDNTDERSDTIVNVETRIVIHRPIEEVFAYVCQSRNLSQRQTGLLEARQMSVSQVGGFFTLAEPLVARSIRRVVESDLGNLKDLLESQVMGISS